MDDLIEEMEQNGFRYVSGHFYFNFPTNKMETTFHFPGDYFDLMNKLAYFQPLIDDNLGEYTINYHPWGLFEVVITTTLNFKSNLLINSMVKKLQHKDFKPKIGNLIPLKFHLG